MLRNSCDHFYVTYESKNFEGRAVYNSILQFLTAKRAY